jgi:hypothetical protein
MRDCISPLGAKSRTKTKGKLVMGAHKKDGANIGSIRPGRSSVDV